MVALLDAGTSLWRLFVGMCWRPLRGTVLTGFGSLWGTPLHTVLRSTFNHRVYASNPWIYFPESYPHGSAPHQPDPPSSLACCLPRVSVVSTSCSSLVVVSAATINTPSQTDISSRRQLGVEDGSCWLSCYRSARSVIFRGIPLTVSPPFTSTHKPFPSPSPSVLVLKHLLPLRESDSFCHATPPHVSSTPVDRRSPAFLLSPNQNHSFTWRYTELDNPTYRRRCSVHFELGHKVMRLDLVDPTVLDDLLIFTETYLHTMSHLSFMKKLQPFHSPGLSSLSSLASFSSEKRSVLSPISFSRSVFPLNVKWRCMPISIIVCLSCGAVRSGPEDATDFVSTVFRGADWVSTSHKVTISQVSGIAMKLASTHSSFSLSSLSTYLRVRMFKN
ncbi:hypothetical protein F2Q70_00018997 [Brassica cretica]|uniref:Uncharacterized protein n=1 Tax=Brassica cretica TaxID=69181 RepID=A0A8S9I4D1_BRACR|nr:hypothetical protein F2Q70_00018997 [Brassica cretica]